VTPINARGDKVAHPALTEARQQALVLSRLIASLRLPSGDVEDELKRPQRRERPAAPRACGRSREAPHKAGRHRRGHPAWPVLWHPHRRLPLLWRCPSTGAEVTRHHLGVEAVRQAGYTVASIRAAAVTGPDTKPTSPAGRAKHRSSRRGTELGVNVIPRPHGDVGSDGSERTA
jgi:hypothetical protein